jgi:uncharacterized linocin/CFP29 family protein
MDLLKRELAPIVPEAWAQIDAEAKRVLSLNLAGRKLVDVEDAQGWRYAAVNTGRLRLLSAEPVPGVCVGVRVVQPLIELRAPFFLPIMELDTVPRGATNVDLDPVVEAAEKVARAEDGAIFNGNGDVGIGGIIPTSSHEPLTIPKSVEDYPRVIVEAVERLRDAGISGPYALALGTQMFKEVFRASDDGYPLRKRIEGQIIDGPLVRAPVIDGAVLLSMRGGDFELSIGQDLSIGYVIHDKTSVELYITESFTFRILEPAAGIHLAPAGKA